MPFEKGHKVQAHWGRNTLYLFEIDSYLRKHLFIEGDGSLVALWTEK